jgi:hypothetical protein
MVKKGYDSDDLQQMSSKKGGYRRAVHLICLVAESYPSIKSKQFLRHVSVFTQNCYKDMQPIQIMRLMKALKQMENFKNEKLINLLQKATIGK